MKKIILYIALFISGIIIGSLVFMDSNFFENDPGLKEESYLVSNGPVDDRKQEFLQSAAAMIGESIIVTGMVQEAYKNKDDEVVIYLKNSSIPVLVNCALIESEKQVQQPFIIGEVVSLQGILDNVSEDMLLSKCRLISRSYR